MSGDLAMFGTPPSIKAVFPGAFNPIHQGHQTIARVAETRLDYPIHFELSVTNVDKPALSYWHLERRIQGLKAAGSYVITSAPTFREKATLFPSACFIVGADTILRIDNDRYYAGPSDRMAAIDYITSQNCRFLVFGRMIDGSFNTLGDLKLSPHLRQLCDEVTASEFQRGYLLKRSQGSDLVSLCTLFLTIPRPSFCPSRLPREWTREHIRCFSRGFR